MTKKIYINSDLRALVKLRRDYPSYPMIGHSSIISIRNKIVHLTDVYKASPVVTLSIDETKLDSSFPIKQFHLTN